LGGFGATAVALLVTTGCGAVYHPRRGPRIVRAEGGYVRDGQRYDVGMLGGGAVDLVAPNVRAAEFAGRKRSLAFKGLALYAVSLATMIAAIPASQAAPGRAREPVFWGLLGSGVVGVGFSIYVGERGDAALADAINVYNDDVEAAGAKP
jgi:hypothetical protein